MEQKIGLFREKQDDILATYIKEFFKLVGFIFRDVIVSEDETENVRYDYIFLIVSNFSSEKNAYTILKKINAEPNTDYNPVILKIQRPERITLDSDAQVCHLFLYDQILKKLFTEEKLEELKNISEIYTKNMLFYFLYNKGILKYVEEYFPITGEYTGEISTNRQKALETTLNVYQKSIYQLEDYMHSQKPCSFHSRYMQLKLRYKINDISNLLGRGHIYRTSNMLKHLDTVMRKQPDFIRAAYLKGHICAADGQYIREAELYYKQAIYSMHTLYPDDAEESFLWYQLGRYYEKKRKDLDKAEICYTESYNRNKKWFRILFKIALFKKRHHNEIETIDLCNQIIAAILNGYKMNELTPKKQIYSFKCFRLLGDAFSDIGRYDLAEISYQRAIQLSEAGNNYYHDLLTKEKGYKCFNEVLSACMPRQPVYRQLVHCAMGMADSDSAENYNIQMKKS